MLPEKCIGLRKVLGLSETIIGVNGYHIVNTGSIDYLTTE